MKKLLIVYPHWPPSNLAGVHRCRLIANFSREFGWDVTVLTVNESHYEETLDPDLCKLVAPHVEVVKTEAWGVFELLGRRLIGDIGIRGWFHLRKRMLALLRSKDFDFVWIPIPSWYTSLLGRVALRKHGIPFGIDYIDPWVYQLTQYEKPFSRPWFARQVALILEPMAIRKAALISGVSAEYYEPALLRNFKQNDRPLTIEMPYGFDPRDHEVELENPALPFSPKEGDFILYAGAFLPHSEGFMAALFRAVQTLDSLGKWPPNLVFRFVGVGSRPGKSISQLAKEAGVAHLVHEHPERHPFLVIQHLLRRATFNVIVGSTEPHYTASKTFQCLLAGKPIFAVFHAESSAMQFLTESDADGFSVAWTQANNDQLEENMVQKLEAMLGGQNWRPNLGALDSHSSKNSARILFEAIERILP